MDAKKSGIRLRHLQQHAQVEKKRDASPNPSNRKKIFEKMPFQKQPERQQIIDRIHSPKLNSFQSRQSPEFQQLVQNLKRKSMQLQLRDNMIRNLNRQIDELKRDLLLKQKEVNKLKGEVNRLQRINRIAKEIQKDNHVFESFRDPEPMHKFGNLKEEENSWGNIPSIKNQQLNSHLSTQKFSQEITMMNLQMKPSPSAQFRQEQPQILSPFMALTNKKVEADTFINQLPIQRDYSHTFHSHPNNIENSFDQQNGYKRQNKSNPNPFDKYQAPHYSNTVSNFNKKPVEYDYLKQEPNSRKTSEVNKSNDNFSKKPIQYEYLRQQPNKRKMSEANKNIDKFNIFGKNEMKTEIRNQSKLQIDDSREFKFDDFDRNDF